jgi:DNA (cytosine-5)-methyltransferase 1
MVRAKSRQLPLFRPAGGLVVDLFAGGGGASVGLEAALGRPVDIAINHSATALEVHCANLRGVRERRAA